jgi:hypothetical protein
MAGGDTEVTAERAPRRSTMRKPYRFKGEAPIDFWKQQWRNRPVTAAKHDERPAEAA